MSDRIKVEGAVFANTYKKAKNHPDFTGKIELSKTLLKELVLLVLLVKDNQVQLLS